jgi:hypothetical protein
VLTIAGEETEDASLLRWRLVSALGSLDLVNSQVGGASVAFEGKRLFVDTFNITDHFDRKLPEAEWERVRSRLLAYCINSNRSTMPNIHGNDLAVNDPMTHMEGYRP